MQLTGGAAAHHRRQRRIGAAVARTLAAAAWTSAFPTTSHALKPRRRRPTSRPPAGARTSPARISGIPTTAARWSTARRAAFRTAGRARQHGVGVSRDAVRRVRRAHLERGHRRRPARRVPLRARGRAAHARAAAADGSSIFPTGWPRADVRATPGYLPYYVAKAGAIALTEALALELAGDNILVNAIAPGPILAPPGTTDEELHAVEAATPLGRWGGTDAIVRAVMFLVETDFVTGETIRVDGGTPPQVAGPFPTHPRPWVGRYTHTPADSAKISNLPRSGLIGNEFAQ